MALDIFAFQMTSKQPTDATKDVVKQESHKETISALWAEYKREKADQILGHLLRPNYPLPQETMDLPPQVEAQQHQHQPQRRTSLSSASSPSEKNHDFEMISRQMSASGDDGCPVVIPRDKSPAELEQERQRREQRRGSRWWEKALPNGVTEDMVHMAFTVS